eukprot:scaffold7052_cov254-Pinguiococcus_pyrenoidosus.AAC.47
MARGPSPVRLLTAWAGQGQGLAYIRIQGAVVLAELLWEHVNHAINEVHACRARPGGLVDSASLPHEVRDVRDVDAHLDRAVAERLHVERIVQVFGAPRVYRKDTLVSKVPPNPQVVVRDGPLLPFGIGKLRRQRPYQAVRIKYNPYRRYAQARPRLPEETRAASASRWRHPAPPSMQLVQ